MLVFLMIELFHKLGPLGYPLLLLSIIALAIIVQRSLALLFGVKRQRAVQQKLSALLQQHAGKPKSVRDEIISFAILPYSEALQAGTRTLRIIAVISPMVGLLGTVLGMISAFKTIAGSEQAVNPAMLADGLWVAMLTTAYGLLIALPALFAAHLFGRIADSNTLTLVRQLNKESLMIEGAEL